MVFGCLMIILTGAHIVHSSFYLTTSLIGTLISALPAQSQCRLWRGFVIVKHRLTVTPVASVVVSDMLLSSDRAGDLWRRWHGVVASPFDVLLNEATPISSLRQGETAAHLCRGRSQSGRVTPELLRGCVWLVIVQNVLLKDTSAVVAKEE